MNSEYVQNLRYKLQKRFRRVNSAGFSLFHFCLKQFWGFLMACPILTSILEDLERRCQGLESQAEEIVQRKKTYVFDDELENAAAGFFVLRKCSESEDRQVEIRIAHSYSHEQKHDDALEQFKAVFLEPLYEYLDEQIDDQRAILAMLRRYKHKCEWFQRDDLFRLWTNDTKRGEKLLALRLYEFLHDQGLDFAIDPWSISGEADLVAAQNSDDPLIADAKIFGPDAGKGTDYIARGLKQLYTYTQDYNEPFGYLIIFNTSEKDLRFCLANQTQSTPFVIYNNKTLFIITIDLYPHETSASKRGRLKPIEIKEEDLIRTIETQENSNG